MKEELKQRKILFYATAYLSNFNYLIVLLVLTNLLEFDKDPSLALIIWGLPAFFSVLVSIFIINDNLLNKKSREQGLMRLAFAHSPSVIGLVGALVYLFVL